MVVESDYLVVVNLLNEVTVDLSKVSFFIAEAKGPSWGLSIFFHVSCYVAHKPLEDHQSSLHIVLCSVSQYPFVVVWICLSVYCPKNK